MCQAWSEFGRASPFFGVKENHMSTFDMNRAGSSSELPVRKNKITEDMIDGDQCVLTVEAAAQVRYSKDNYGLVVHFKEFPEHAFNCNRTQEDVFIDLIRAGILPSETKQWAGVRIPMFKRENDYDGKTFVKLYPFSADEYHVALSDYDKSKAAPSSGRTAPARSGGGRKSVGRK